MQKTTPQDSLVKCFSGAQIVSFESRQADKMVSLIRRYEGLPVSAPSLQEIPLQKNPEVRVLGQRLLAGDVSVLVFMTGVGVQWLGEMLIKDFDRPSIVEALSRVTTVARGPKTVSALQAFGIQPTLMVPDPGTTQEILEILDISPQGVALEGALVALQAHSASERILTEELKKRGARVLEVPVYRWTLPDNTEPLRQAMERILIGDISAVLFTNSAQVQNVLKFAAESGYEEALRKAFKKTLVASIGPSCSEKMRELGIAVDFEAPKARMDELVQSLAKDFSEIWRDKERPYSLIELECRESDPEAGRRFRRVSPFMKACRREETPVRPVWLMRQAGRYMKEYRKLRSKVGFLELCKNKDLCAEVTVHAQETLGVDAAILFSDILLIVEPFGLKLEYSQGDGPVISNGGELLQAVDRLPEVNPVESLSFVMDAVKLIRSSLKPEIPLIGFSGAPFTLASYMIEGGGSKVFLKTKKFMQGDSGAWHALMEKISRAVAGYLNAQIEAGADTVQLFDSWAGCLSAEDYREFVLPHTRSVIQSLKPGVPVIHFATGTGGYLPLMREAGGDVLGVDFRVPLDQAWREIGYDRAIQGNLDPALLFAPREVLLEKAARILEQAGSRPGFIFNLGHGILPETPLENVQALIEFVHSYRN